MFKNWYALSMTFMLLSATFIFSSCDEDDIATSDDGLIEFLEDSPEFSMLRDALDEADLIDNIRLQDNNITLFAPTNTALQAFMSANGFATLEDIPDDMLESLLRGHIIDDELTAGELATGYYETINDESLDGDFGTSLYVSNQAGTFKINGSVTITDADQMTDDGVIHAIDQVIALPTVVTFALSNPDFSMLVAALSRTDLNADFVSTLQGNGPYTVFAPTNAAFQALLDSTNEWDNINDIPADVLREALELHVVTSANLRSEDLDDGETFTTLNGQTLSPRLNGNTLQLTTQAGQTVSIAVADVQATNGVIHAIDQVLMPN